MIVTEEYTTYDKRICSEAFLSGKGEQLKQRCQIASSIIGVSISRGDAYWLILTYQLLNLLALRRRQRVDLLLRQIQNLHQHLLSWRTTYQYGLGCSRLLEDVPSERGRAQAGVPEPQEEAVAQGEAGPASIPGAFPA